MNNKKQFLNDKAANIILSDKSCRGFLVNLISKALNMDINLVKDNLQVVNTRVNNNINKKYSYVDNNFENNTSYITIEVNLVNNKETTRKNMRYVCNLIIDQVNPGKIDNYKPVRQINLNYFDLFNENKFIYRSSIIEEELHIKRNDDLTIVDINLEFLRNIDYNKIKKEEDDSLEKSLYFFVCNNLEVLDKLYVDNDIMEKVTKKLNNLTKDFKENLYYDYDEFVNAVSKEEGCKEIRLEIARKLIGKLSIEEISDITGLSKEQLEDLK